MHRRTKIICTMGPACNSYDMVCSLIDAGMNVARLNMSHGTHASHLEVINTLKKARQDKGVPLAIMLDTKGPEIRIGAITDGEVALQKEGRINLVSQEDHKDAKSLPITPSSILEDLKPNMRILFDDGYIEAHVIECTKQGVVVECLNSGTIKSGKGVNIPHESVDLPAVTEQDIKDIIFGCESGVDLIAASFIRSPDHVITIKEITAGQGLPDLPIIAKIESASGVAHFDAILQVTDGIMIARGDLGVELPLTHVPRLQKMMIKKCYQAAKPVITATQMLESMIHNAKPTRAEISDVANAIYDSTSCVMLSGETAVGKYPIECVTIMKQTIEQTEKHFDYSGFFYRDLSEKSYTDISSAVALAAVKTLFSAGGRAIITFTATGTTARTMSRFRPQMPIIAITPYERIYHRLAVIWGVVPHMLDVKDVEEGFDKACNFCVDKHYVKFGDLVVVTAGSPFGTRGSTNTLFADYVGDVIARGISSKGKRVSGKAALHLKKDATLPKDTILVLYECNKSYIPLLGQATAVILEQSQGDDHTSSSFLRQYSHDHNLPVLLHVENACNVIKEGQAITLDQERGLIFEGHHHHTTHLK